MPLNPKAIQRNFILVQNEEPQSPQEGQIWLRTTDGATFQYFNGEWEQIGQEPDGKTIVENEYGELEQGVKLGSFPLTVEEIPSDLDHTIKNKSMKIISDGSNAGHIDLGSDAFVFDTENERITIECEFNFEDITVSSRHFEFVLDDSNDFVGGVYGTDLIEVQVDGNQTRVDLDQTTDDIERVKWEFDRDENDDITGTATIFYGDGSEQVETASGNDVQRFYKMKDFRVSMYSSDPVGAVSELKSVTIQRGAI